MVHRNVYVPRGQKLTAVTRAVAAWLWSGRTATVAGLSAAALYRTEWIDPWLPAELNRRSRDKARGIILHRGALGDDETCVRDGIRLTTPARTAFDLGRRNGLTSAVIRLDALMHATEVKVADIELLADRHQGARGLVQLRQALPLVDGGSESPYETKTRLVLIGGGLPRPQTQIEVLTDWGTVLARIDMGWEEWKVGVEFDGAHHWLDSAQRTRDIDRLAETRGPRLDHHPGQRRPAATPSQRRRRARPSRPARRRLPTLASSSQLNVELLGQKSMSLPNKSTLSGKNQAP